MPNLGRQGSRQLSGGPACRHACGPLPKCSAGSALQLGRYSAGGLPIATNTVVPSPAPACSSVRPPPRCSSHCWPQPPPAASQPSTAWSAGRRTANGVEHASRVGARRQLQATGEACGSGGRRRQRQQWACTAQGLIAPQPRPPYLSGLLSGGQAGRGAQQQRQDRECLHSGCNRSSRSCDAVLGGCTA